MPNKAQCNDVFRFNHVQGMKYRILSVADQSVLINGQLSHQGEILNRIAVEITNVTDGRGTHRAVFQSSQRFTYSSLQRMYTASEGFHWAGEYESVFERDRQGRLTIDPQYFMPVLRNVPVFPDRTLRVGERWSAEGHEIHDFRRSFGIQQPYRIPFTANYVYLGEREWKGSSYPSFSVNYQIDSRPPAVRGRTYPVRINAEFSQIYYWDRSHGLPAAYQETFRITFEMSDRRTIEYRGTSLSELIEAHYMDRQRMISEITEEINRLEIQDVSVRAVDEGISISLENIGFHADSDRMLPGEMEKLERIAAILMRYQDRDIMISGHTALAGNAEERMRLSQDRARTVADYLLERNVRPANRMVIRGHGAERPIADNSTEEGMRRNRRVEITILEN